MLNPKALSIINDCVELAQKSEKREKVVLPGNGKKTKTWDLFDPSRRRCGYDNSKIGALSATISAMPGTVNTLSYNACVAILEEYKAMIDKYGADYCVSCPCDCPGCYAMKEKRYSAVMETLLLNTIELHIDPARFYALVENEIFFGKHAGQIEKVRIHECGEFVNENDFSAAMDMMKKHPDMPFFGYSKRDFVGRAYLNGQIPENVRFSCSPWETRDGKVLCAPIGDMHQFIYDDGTDPKRDKIVHCWCSNPDGTVNKENTCSDCGRCIRAKEGTRTAVFPHGVKLSETWLAGRARYYMETGETLETASALAFRDGMTVCKKWTSTLDSESIFESVRKLARAIKNDMKERGQC